jgi:non-ribosomal peptide synthase protein (TIGR01720 family)
MRSPEAIGLFHLIDVSELPSAQQTTAVSEHLASMHAGFHLAEGGLFKGIFFQCGGKQADRLILIAHHLVIDSVSWQILVGELDSAMQALLSGGQISLVPVTMSYAKWGAFLAEYAKSDAIAQELGFWQAQTQVPPTLPADFDVALPVAEHSIDVLAHVWEASESQKLLGAASKAYHTRTEEMLIAALMMTLEDWAGISELCLGLERHGREATAADFDLSGSVGWFTTYFPLRLTIDRGAEIGTILKSVKEQMRKVPQGGLGYGLLRYLAGRSELIQRPLVLFNFLGRRELFNSPELGRTEVLDSGARDARSERYYQFEINIFVEDGRLNTRWSYSRDQYRGETIEGLISAFFANLQRLVDHGAAAESGEYTPSDFPEADLSQGDLDRLFDQLDL